MLAFKTIEFRKKTEPFWLKRLIFPALNAPAVVSWGVKEVSMFPVVILPRASTITFPVLTVAEDTSIFSTVMELFCNVLFGLKRFVRSTKEFEFWLVILPTKIFAAVVSPGMGSGEMSPFIIKGEGVEVSFN